MTLPTLGASITKDIYGTDASDAVSHGLVHVNNSNKMSGGIFYNMAQKAIAERTRRGGSSVAIPSNYYTGKLFASKIQEIKTNVEVAGPAATQAYNTNYGGGANSGNPPAVTTFSQIPAPSGASNFVKGARITSAIVNALIDEINSAGAVCTCNCNYCTCNCNYCTCNCNYSCTCNCNYSDEQVKSNVEYM
jgi:hypothetical protein